MKSEWIWMPHAGHFCAAKWCQFHLNTYVNGCIVSTVGEYFPDQAVRRIFVESGLRWPKLHINEKGQLEEKKIDEKLVKQLLELKGDAFDDAYLHMFGFEEIGMNRTYETMTFKAIPRDEIGAECCPFKAGKESLYLTGYQSAPEAYRGHLRICEEYDSIQGSKDESTT